jgi:hypothetical protein
MYFVLIFLDTYFVDTQQWKSNLKDAGDTVSKFLQPLNCELVSKTSPYRCSSWDIAEENVSLLLTAQTQACTVMSESCGTQLFNAPSVSGADSLQDISKLAAEDDACKQFVDLCLPNMVEHEILFCLELFCILNFMIQVAL